MAAFSPSTCRRCAINWNCTLIATAQARREWPNGLYLHLVEEAPVARWGEDQFLNGRGQVLPGVAADDFTELPQLIGAAGEEAAVMAQYRQFAARLAPDGLRVERLEHSAAGCGCGSRGRST